MKIVGLFSKNHNTRRNVNISSLSWSLESWDSVLSDVNGVSWEKLKFSEIS